MESSIQKVPGLEVIAASPNALGSRGWLGTGLIVVQFEGTAETEDGPVLARLLGHVHSLALERQVSAVTVEIMRLRFMTSSCFKEFVTWIQAVLQEQRRYKINFRISPSIRWQKGSLHTLITFGPEIVSIGE